jgi:hypothetical protein
VPRSGQEWVKRYFSELRLVAFPNPSRHVFYLSIISGNTTTPVHLRVLNNAGSVVEVKTAKPYQVIQLGALYRPGIYYVEAVQDAQRATVKLIKR